MERPKRAAPSRLPAPVLIGGAYLAGPLSLVYLRRGANATAWAATSVVSTATLAFLAWRRLPLLASLHEGYLTTLFVVALAAGMVFLAVACWARAVLLAARETAPRRERFPAWIRSPWTVGILGGCAPGLGLMLAGRPRRAAWAVLWAGALGAALTVLAHAGWLWSWWMGSFGIEGTGIELEAVFLGAGLTVAAGAAAWIIQALDGVRLSLPESSSDHPRRDLFALALVAALAAFPLAFRPAGLAADLADLAVALRLDGLRAVPLTLAVTAQRLDPSQPIYALRAADLYEDMGGWGEAGTLRAGVARRWASVAPEMRRLSRPRSDGTAPADLFPREPLEGASVSPAPAGPELPTTAPEPSVALPAPPSPESPARPGEFTP